MAIVITITLHISRLSEKLERNSASLQLVMWAKLVFQAWTCKCIAFNSLVISSVSVILRFILVLVCIQFYFHDQLAENWACGHDLLQLLSSCISVCPEHHYHDSGSEPCQFAQCMRWCLRSILWQLSPTNHHSGCILTCPPARSKDTVKEMLSWASNSCHNQWEAPRSASFSVAIK